ALRHSPDGQPPTVTLSSIAGRGEARIIDRGPGIPAEDRLAVFVPFQRLGDSDERGLGLGLALCRGLIEAMEGTVQPEDTPGGGLTMVVSLPLADEAVVGEVAPGQREREDAGA
ncbi:MAG: ATP-binding protein, partial [Micropruina sp.]